MLKSTRFKKSTIEPGLLNEEMLSLVRKCEYLIDNAPMRQVFTTSSDKECVRVTEEHEQILCDLRRIIGIHQLKPVNWNSDPFTGNC